NQSLNLPFPFFLSIGTLRLPSFDKCLPVGSRFERSAGMKATAKDHPNCKTFDPQVLPMSFLERMIQFSVYLLHKKKHSIILFEWQSHWQRILFSDVFPDVLLLF